MKKLFSKILSASIMFLCCMLSFVSFVKADGPDWLDPKGSEYRLFFELSEESQTKLIALHKNIINMNEKYNRVKKKLFFDTLKELDSLKANLSKETDKKIIPVVTGYLKKDNNVYTNLSVLTKLTGCCRSSINDCFQELHYRSVNSLGCGTRHGNIQSLNLYGGLCEDIHYNKKWSIKVLQPYQPPQNTDSAVPRITLPLVAPAQAVISRPPSSVLGSLTSCTVESSNDQPQITTQMQPVPINNAAVKNNTSADFASLYVYPRLLLNKHTNTDNSFY